MRQTRARSQMTVPLSLALLCGLAFAPGLTSPLTLYDDPQYISASALMTRGGWAGFAEVWNPEHAWRGDFIEFFPLRDSVYWLLFQRWGALSTPFHVVTLGFHVLTTLLVWLLLRRLQASAWVAAVGAALFAVHPIHVESVTWAAGLKDPMYTALMLGSVLCWLRYRDSARPRFYVLSLALLVASLLTKSMASVTPLLLVALDRWGPGTPSPWRRLLAGVTGHVLISALFMALFVGIARANHVLVGPHGGGWLSHLVLSSWAQVLYLRQAFVPVGFKLIYCFSPVTGLTDPRLLGALGLALLVGLAILRFRALPLRLFCVAWYAACLAPVSNLVPFPAIVADRYLYAASIAVCLLIALSLEAVTSRLKTVLAVAIVSTLLLVCTARAALWQNEEDLWAESDEDPACLVDPSFRAAQAHLMRFRSTTDFGTAMAALERTAASPAVQSGNFPPFCETLLAGARLALSKQDQPHALRWARDATLRCPGDADVWNAWVEVNLHRDPTAAAEGAERAWRLGPSPHALLWRGLTALEVNADARAVEWVREAVKASPGAACRALAGWARAAPPRAVEAVAESLAACAAIE